MAWCLQCGSAGKPEPAAGVDEDGEPACVFHRAKPPAIELPPCIAEPIKARPIEAVKAEATQPETSEAMETKKCPGYEKDCLNRIGLRKEICGTCYARRAYQQKQAGKKRAFKVKAPKGVKLPNPEPSTLDRMGVEGLGALKDMLKRRLEAVEAVERMLAGGWADA